MSEEKQATKICKHCKTEIPYDAKVCPQCNKKQGGKLKWIIIAIVVLGIIGAAADDGDDEDVKQTDKEYSVDNMKQEDDSQKEEPEEKESENEEENQITVGSSFEKDGLQITVNDADLEFTDYSDEYGMYAPENGMKYIMVSFTFENNGDSDAFVSVLDFNCYADNTNCEQAYLPDLNDFSSTQLSSGRNVSFKTYYTVPVDAQSIELEYETSFWTDEKAIIKLQ